MMNTKLVVLALIGVLFLALPAHADPHRYGSMIHNLDATTDPGVTDDISPGGYTVGSMWVNVTDDTVWICADNTNGAAVWKQVDAAGGGASQLSDLSDVTSAATTNRYALLANGSAYVGRALTYADISDIAANVYTETEVDNIATALAAGDTGGPVCTPATPTTTWTPSVTGCAIVPATITGPQSTTVNDPGAVGSGNVEKLLTVTASGGTVTLDLSAYSLPTSGLSPPLTIASGETREYLIWTDDSGTTWNLTSDTPDLSALSAVTLATGDLLEVQDVSPTPDVHGKVTIDDVTTYVGGNVSIDDSQVTGNQTTVTDDTTVTGDDHGKTIVCNKGTAMTIDVDDGTANWSPNVRVYVLNIGAGDCTIQDGSTADVTIHTATGFTAVVPQYSGATIIGVDVDEVVVTGGEAS